MKELIKPQNDDNKSDRIIEVASLLCENYSCYCRGKFCTENYSDITDDDEILF